MNSTNFFVFLVFFQSSLLCFGQNKYFGSSGIIGTSVTYIHNYEKIIEHTYETTWNVNIALSVGEKMHAGMQLLTMYTKGSNRQSANYTIYGIFGQYNFLNITRRRLYAEGSINRGNFYINKDHSFSYKYDTWYVGTGICYDHPIKKISPNLFVELSGYVYVPLPINQDIYYTQYIIGLNYRLNSRNNPVK